MVRLHLFCARSHLCRPVVEAGGLLRLSTCGFAAALPMLCIVLEPSTLTFALPHACCH